MLCLNLGWMVGGGGGFGCDVIFNITEGVRTIFFVLEGGYCLSFCYITLVFQPPPLLIIIAQSLSFRSGFLMSNTRTCLCDQRDLPLYFFRRLVLLPRKSTTITKTTTPDHRLISLL